MTPFMPPAGQALAPSRYLDAVGAARYCGLSLTFVRRLTSERQIPYIAIGRRRLYDRAALDRWIQRRAVLPKGWAA
jgi:excisionase family DNA binding protein